MKTRLLRLLICVVIVAAVVPFAPQQSASADNHWLDGWAWRRKLRFLNATNDVLTDQRILVVLSSGRIEYANMQPQGQDLRFTQSDGHTLLKYQIAHWKGPGEDKSYVYVLVPSIQKSNYDYIYMYYGNPAAQDEQDRNGTWPSTYRGVWLLNETQGIYRDSESSTSTNFWGDY